MKAQDEGLPAEETYGQGKAMCVWDIAWEATPESISLDAFSLFRMA